jgi:hypothetical protein
MVFFRSCAGVATVVALLVGSSKVEAFWRLPCQGRSGLARIDPLKNFGTVSEHAHVIHGGTSEFILFTVFQRLYSS